MLAARTPSARQKPAAKQRSYPGRAEDDPERGASYHSWHPGELSVKLLDIRPHDRDVAAELVLRIKQR